MKRRSAALAVAALAVGQASIARADEAADRLPESILVGPSACGEVPWTGAAWTELLRVELAADGTRILVARANDPAPTGAPRIRLEPDACDASVRSATLTLDIGTERIDRMVDLTQVEPRARARVLALAAAELIQSSRARLAAAATNASARQELTIRVQVTTTPLRAPEPDALVDSFGLFAAGEGRVFAGGNAGLFGARGGARFPLFAWSALAVDGGFLIGGARDPLGEVDATLASIGLGALAVGGVRDVALSVGPRVEVGLASFTGRAFASTTMAASVSSPLVVFSLSATASFRIARGWSGLLGLDAGTTLYSYGARADGRHVSDFAGPMLGTRLGVMWNAR